MLALWFVGACADVPETDVARVGEPDLRVFRVPGLDGTRLEVRTASGGFAAATRDGPELAVVLQVAPVDRAEVAVFDPAGELLGHAVVELRPVDHYVLDHTRAGAIDPGWEKDGPKDYKNYAGPCTSPR